MMQLNFGHLITLHGLIVMVGLALYVTTSHTLHLRRHPSTAIAWVITLILLPYVALPLYLMFGSRKVEGYRRVTPLNMSSLPNDSSTLALRTRQLAALMELPAASHYQHLNLHQDGTQALRSLLNMINAATATIDICTFMFARDNLGDEIAQNLSQKARQGIRVRLLVDGLGTYLGHTHFTQLQEAGVHVVFFILPLRSSLYGRSNLRNHRKMVITDHHWLWCGGRNFATEYFAGDAQNSPENKAWIDLTFDLQGALAQQAQQQFEQDWAFATRHDSPLPLRGVQDAQAEAPLAQLIPSGPDQADDTLYTLLVSGFFNSSQRILAVTPYFVPDPTLLMSLALAARRGVKVDLLIPRKSNHRLADLARHRALRELAAAGANVWLCPGMIHAKAIVIDEQLALAGSANLDQRSLFLNYELMVAFYSPGDIAHFAEWMENQRIGAVLYRAKTPTMMREIAEGLLLWLAFQL